MNFKAAVLIKTKKIEILDLYLPKLRKGQVLVKIIYTSICHTQIQEIDGLRGKDRFLPHCLGHEATGVIVDKHYSVNKVKKSDHVCLSWINSSGINAGGVTYLTKSNKQVSGGPVHTFCEYAIISENKIYKIKNSKNIKKNVLLGCALPTAFNAIDSLNLKQINSICIVGCGGLGMSSILAAKKNGIENISVIDYNEKKLSIAKKNGAKYIYKNFSQIKNKNNMFDVIVECTGNIKILEASLDFVKKFGGKIIVIGNYPNGQMLKINPWHIIQGKTLQGAWNNQNIFDKNFSLIQKKVSNLKLDFYFGNKIYDLENINSAIKDFKKGKMIRPLIKI
jgi:S-(hydroxymethyl)glutathione dehydrogenase/alcohol dehydrogenase